MRRVTRGLTPAYYFFHQVFGLIFLLFMIGVFLNDERDLDPEPIFWLIILAVANTLFYPYAQFVLDKSFNFIGSFIAGNKLFTIVKYVLFPTHIFTMIYCWVISILIALIGMFVLYFYNKKYEPVTIQEQEHWIESSKTKNALMPKKSPLSRRKSYEKQNKGSPVVIRRGR